MKSNFSGMRIALVGFGHVGRALAGLILRTGVPFQVTALGTKSHGAAVGAGGRGIALTQVLAGTDLPLRALPPIGDLPADVLVEISTLDPETGEPALSYIR